MNRIRPLAGDASAESLVPLLVDSIHEAGNPYFDWIFDGPERARETLSNWMHRASSEVYVGLATICEIDSIVAGVYIALDGAALSRCRAADTLAMVQAFGQSERKSLMDRMRATRGMFSTANDDQFYLSKIGVAREHRGEGLGRTLLESYLSTGRRAGYRKFVLDVARDNQAAISLYRDAGFTLVPGSRDILGPLAYVSMVREEAVI